jgi:hypothetical protein
MFLSYRLYNTFSVQLCQLTDGEDSLGRICILISSIWKLQYAPGYEKGALPQGVPFLFLFILEALHYVPVACSCEALAYAYPGSPKAPVAV